MNAIAYVVHLLDVLPQLIAAGVEISAFVREQREKVQRMADERRDPTAQEWDELNAEIARLRGQLHAPDGSGGEGG